MIHDEYEPSRLNRITEQLLKQGHTKDKTPPGMKDWNFFYRGWTFSSETLQDMTFETPCGLLVKGSRFTAGCMSCKGVDWMPENDNPTVTCPYFDRPDCSLVHEALRRHAAGIAGKEKLHFCNCHLSERVYDYDHSLDKAHDDVRREAETLWQRFSDERHGRVCKQHAAYNRATKQWSIHYDPFVCARERCARSRCPVLDREISDRKANIYFDVITIWTDKGEGMFPDMEKTRIEKGIRLLDRQVSETICGAIVKYVNVGEYICFRRGWNKLKFRLSGTTCKVVNVRVERRERRDLQQDLHDIAAGIEVATHPTRPRRPKRRSRNGARRRRRTG